MRTAATSLLAGLAGLAGIAHAQSKPIDLIVEKLGCEGYVNTTVKWTPYDTGLTFEDPGLLSKVSGLYIEQEDISEYTFFCFAYKPDGTAYNKEAFWINHPLILAAGNVVVQYIHCLTE
ncbi:hypothetical protein F5B22DRAFT_645802 [Xylaria bambusicola]|uniref:uncharacterized protein n=1 Tax=Xylaria bambusicola TaxID=326684 RepID=UPI002008BE22|nr:uncharacterized protein F5B22DRAFT_645802 [Xylaria bambusicola]KAI0517623.1 hypothetical protein F5B22DRAFT_645802 [Xylaria bambusicola]